MIIHSWSAPRCLSTVTMYSFAQRPDCVAFDEPLYAYYLTREPHVFRSYRDDVLSSQNPEGNQVLRNIIQLSQKDENKEKIFYVKHMSKFRQGLDPGLLFNDFSKHIFLLREPFDVVSSWSGKAQVAGESFDVYDTCFPQLLDIYMEVLKITGQKPVIIDTQILKQDPEHVIQECCVRLGIPFYPQQLHWPSGPKPHLDGVWASSWYKSAWSSTGFVSDRKSERVYPTLNLAQLNVYRQSLPFYELLKREALGRHPLETDASTLGNSQLYLPNSMPQDASIAWTLTEQRNQNIIAFIGNRLVPREYAKISAFDSAVQGGDAVWEGLRIYNDKILHLELHLDRLFDSAKALSFAAIPSRHFIRDAIFRTLAANGMRNNVHIRLTLTRGVKASSSMNPKMNCFGCCLIVLPEWKPVGSATIYDNQRGIHLITATNRRNPPSTIDSKIHHCNLINNILPKIQANVANAADAIMLDIEGFVAETNATNLFLVKNNHIITPTADHCLPGITRKTVMELAQKLEPPVAVEERRVSLMEFHAADEVFVTGTMGELTPVVNIDGREIGAADRIDLEDVRERFPVFNALQRAYCKLTEDEGYPLPDFEDRSQE